MAGMGAITRIFPGLNTARNEKFLPTIIQNMDPWWYTSWMAPPKDYKSEVDFWSIGKNHKEEKDSIPHHLMHYNVNLSFQLFSLIRNSFTCISKFLIHPPFPPIYIFNLCEPVGSGSPNLINWLWKLRIPYLVALSWIGILMKLDYLLSFILFHLVF